MSLAMCSKVIPEMPCQHVEVWTKMTFCRQYLQIKIVLIVIIFSVNVGLCNSWTCDKPLSEPMATHFVDVYTRVSRITPDVLHCWKRLMVLKYLANFRHYNIWTWFAISMKEGSHPRSSTVERPAIALQWRHNDQGVVSNHQPHGC